MLNNNMNYVVPVWILFLYHYQLLMQWFPLFFQLLTHQVVYVLCLYVYSVYYIDSRVSLLTCITPKLYSRTAIAFFWVIKLLFSTQINSSCIYFFKLYIHLFKLIYLSHLSICSYQYLKSERWKRSKSSVLLFWSCCKNCGKIQ